MKKGKPKGARKRSMLKSLLSFALIAALAFGNIVPLNVAKAEGEGESSETNTSTANPPADLLNVDFDGDWNVVGPKLGWEAEDPSVESLTYTLEGESNTNRYLKVTSTGNGAKNLFSFFTNVDDSQLGTGEVVYEYMLSAEVSPEDNTKTTLPAYFKTHVGAGPTALVCIRSGKLWFNNAKSNFNPLGTIEAGAWTRIAVVINYGDKTEDGYAYKLYVDDVCVKDYNGLCDSSMYSVGMKERSPQLLGIRLEKDGKGAGTFLMDNVRVYVGSNPDIKIVSTGTTSSYARGSGCNVTIQSTGDRKGLQSIMIGSEMIDSSSYSVAEGEESTAIVTFNEEYLESLPIGKHSVTLKYSGDRSVETQLEILPRATKVTSATSSYNKKSDAVVSIVTDGTMADLQSVAFGETVLVADTDYTVSGDDSSTTVTLKNSFLDALKTGEHRVTLAYTDDRAVSADLAVLLPSALVPDIKYLDFEGEWAEFGPKIGVSTALTNASYTQIYNQAALNKFLKVKVSAESTNMNNCFGIDAALRTGKVVYEYKISADPNEATETSANLTNNSRLFRGNSSTYLYLYFNKIKMSSSGEVLGTVEAGKWTKVSMVVDYSDNSYQFYINDELKFTSAAGAFTGLTGIRVRTVGHMLIDDMRIYYGDEPLADYISASGSAAALVQSATTPSYEQGMTNLVMVKADGARDHFVGVKVDGADLASENFALSGTTMTTVTLDNDYLDGLTAGDHTVTLLYEGNVSVDATLTIIPSSIVIDEEESTTSYIKGTTGGIVIKASGAAAELQGVTVNGKELKVNVDYTVSGDAETTVTFMDDYIDAIEPGKYEVVLIYSGDHKGEMELQVSLDPNNATLYTPDILSINFDGNWADFGAFISKANSSANVLQIVDPSADYEGDKVLKMVRSGANVNIIYPSGTAAITTTGKQIVYEYKVSVLDDGTAAKKVKLFASTTDAGYVYMGTNGKLASSLNGDPSFGTVTAGTWTKLALAVDYATNTYKLYVNDVLMKDSTGFKNSGDKFARITIGDFDGHVLIDDLRVYEGTEPHVPGTAEPVGTEVYVDRTFDEIWKYDFEEIEVKRNSGTVAVTGNENKYLAAAGTADSPAVITYKTDAESNFIIAHGKFALENTSENAANIFTGIGADGKEFTFLKLVGASVQLPDGTEVATLTSGTYTEIAVAVNASAKKYSVYVNGEKLTIANNVTIAEITEMASIVTTVTAGCLIIDDLRVYDAKKPQYVWRVDDKPNTIYKADSVAQGLIGEARAIQLNANVLYADGVKSFASKPFDTSDAGKVYLALADIEALFGANADITTASMKNGAYDVIAVAKASGYTYVHEMEGRMMLFGKSEITLEPESTNEKEVNKYLQFDRPTVDTIKELFSMSNTHPRVLVTQDDVDRIKGLYTAGDTIVKRWGDNAIAAAEAALLEADLTFYKYGSSLAHVDVCAPMFINLGFAYFLSDDAEAKAAYVEKVKRTVNTICELEDWNPLSYLDVGELSFLLGLAYDWFYDEFTAEERVYIEKNLMEKGIGIQNKIYYGKVSSDEVYWTWWDNTNNWNLVCNGGAICGAIALYDVYPDICAQVIANTLHGAEFMMESYFPEGVWHEGGGYWNYALRYLAYLMDTMDNVFADDFGFMCSPGLESTGWYGLKLSGSTGINNFGDAGSSFINNPRVLWCAKMFGDADMMAARLQEMELQGYVGAGSDLLYYDADLYQSGGSAEVPLDTVLDSMSIVSLRERWYDIGATYLGFSGSKTKSGHAHMDVGAFVVDMLGQRIIQEAGAEDYQADGYFSTNRYYYYRTRPEGHNIYIINPTDNRDDYGGYTPWVPATNTPVVAKARGAFSTLDLSNVYAEDTNSAIRGYMLTDDRRSVLVRDEIDFKAASEIYSYMHTAAAIEIDPATPNVAILTLKGTRYKVIVDVQGDTVESWTLKDVEAKSRADYGVKDSANTIRKLEIYVKTNAAGPISITTKIIGYDDPAANKAVITTPIAQWSADMIPDGEAPVIPELDMIYVNGEPLKTFDPGVTGYTGFLYATEKMPVITASSAKYNRIEIDAPSDFGNDYVIRVYDNEDENLYRVYRLSYQRRPALKPVDGRERYPVASMTASASPQAESHGYTPDSAIDNDFSVSRWTSECASVGESHWLMMELEEVSKVYKIGFAFVNGQKRKNVFTIEISEDGQTWTKVFDGMSSGTTAGLEYFYENDEGINIKFVRYTGYGNIVNNGTGISNLWNNIAEMVVLGPEKTAEDIYELESNTGLDILSTNKTADLAVGEDGSTIIGVAVDGTALAPENFTVADGTTTDGKAHTVSIKAEYMEALAPGEHTVTLTYKDGSSRELKVTVEAPTALEIIENGTVDEYENGSDAAVTIHTTGLVAKFIGVKVNGTLVAHENYEVTEGSTIITFKNGYLDTLAAGDYKVEVLYSGNRSVEATLTISEKDETTTEAAGDETTTEAAGDDATTEGAGGVPGASESTEANDSTEATESTEADASTEAGTDTVPGGDPDTGDMGSTGRFLWLFAVAAVVMTGYALAFERKRQK